jgi:hypothetical protein
MVRIFCVAAIVLSTASPARAQPQTIRLTVAAAAAPVPALEYQLLPDIRDSHPGNAALLYQRAHSPDWFSSFRRHADYLKVADWVELPSDKLPWDRVKSLLPQNVLKEVDLAARREYCDWELTDRIRQDGFEVLIPDFQGFREYAMLLALRARLEVHEGRLDKAIYTCQTGLALSRHTAQAPTLVTGLVGMAIANTMLGQVEGLIEQGGSPNLYWALTDLPRPFFHLRRCFQGERIAVDAALLPRIGAALRDPTAAPLTTTELQAINRKLLEFAPEKNEFATLGLAVLAAKVYPQAKQFLLKRGFTAVQVDALPVVQVAYMYALAQYYRHFDNMVKWVQLPYWQARPGLLQAERELKSSKARFLETGGIPLAELLLPAAQRVVLTRARLDRRIAALRCVEALRLYAAAHEGRLPAELSDVQDVPVPIDPITGKSFQYRLEGSAAVLFAPPSEGEPAAQGNSLRYEITLRQ